VPNALKNAEDEIAALGHAIASCGAVIWMTTARSIPQHLRREIEHCRRGRTTCIAASGGRVVVADNPRVQRYDAGGQPDDPARCSLVLEIGR
jgi:hypothetical protein